MSTDIQDYEVNRLLGTPAAGNELVHPPLHDFDGGEVNNSDGAGNPWFDLHRIYKGTEDWDGVWNSQIDAIADRAFRDSVRISRLYNSLGLEDPEARLNPTGAGSSASTPWIGTELSSTTFTATQPDLTTGVIGNITDGMSAIQAAALLSSIIGTRSFTGDPTDGFTWRDNIGRDGNIISANSTITRSLDQLDQAFSGGIASYTGYTSNAYNGFWNAKNSASLKSNVELMNRAIGDRELPTITTTLGPVVDERPVLAGFEDNEYSVSAYLRRIVSTIGDRSIVTAAGSTTVNNGGASESHNYSWATIPSFTNTISNSLLDLNVAIGNRVILNQGYNYPLSGLDGSTVTSWVNSINTAIGTRQYTNTAGAPLAGHNGETISASLDRLNTGIGAVTTTAAWQSGTTISTLLSSITSRIDTLVTLYDPTTVTIASGKQFRVSDTIWTISGAGKGYRFITNPGGGSNHTAGMEYFVTTGANTTLRIYNRDNAGDIIEIDTTALKFKDGVNTTASFAYTGSSFNSPITNNSTVRNNGVVSNYANVIFNSAFDVTAGTVDYSTGVVINKVGVVETYNMSSIVATNTNSTYTGGQTVKNNVTDIKTGGTSTVTNVTETRSGGSQTYTDTAVVLAGSSSMTIPNLIITGPVKDSLGNVIIPDPGVTPAIDIGDLEDRISTLESTVGGSVTTWASITGKPSTFAPSAHTHLWADLTDKPTTFAPAAHTQDWSTITGKPATFTASSHTHLWADITDKPTSFASNWSTLSSIPSNIVNAATTYAPIVHNHDSAYLTKTTNATTSFTITAAGFNVSSDRRLKTDIRELNRGLAEVLALSPVKYRYTQDTRETVRYGLIAQDVLKICPAAVSRDENDMLSIDYAQLVPILINAIQELAG